MAMPNQEEIKTFMSITGVSEAAAIQKLEEHGGNLNEAVNAHFSEGDRNITQEASNAATRDDDMDIDRRSFPLLPSNRNLNPFSLLDSHFGSSRFDGANHLTRDAPYVTHPREVREIPIEVKDGNEQSFRSRSAPTIEDISGTAQCEGTEVHGTIIIEEDDDENVPTGRAPHATDGNAPNDQIFGAFPRAPISRPSVPDIEELPDYSNDIEEQMIRAAIEASKRDAEMLSEQHDVDSASTDNVPQQRPLHMEDTEIAHAEAYKSAHMEDLRNLSSSNGRLQVGSSSVHDEETEDIEEQPLVRHRSRNVSMGSVDAVRDIDEVEVRPLSSPQCQDDLNPPQFNNSNFPSDEWGGMSSLEHDEAVMLEAAMFGGIPEGSGFRIPFAPHHLMQNGQNRNEEDPYAWRTPRPPSPSLTSQRLLREQQDDEYLAALQVDREKGLRAREEAEAALAEQRRKDEEVQRKAEEEQEIERQLAAKEASLPQEPASDDENAVTLLVRMADGSRRGRRFLKSDKLQYLFDFIDISRKVKPQTYRLVRPYPRRAFSDGESTLTLNELGLTSKQEALFLERI